MVGLKHSLSVFLLVLASALCSANKPELVVETDHSASVQSVAFSPDGKTLASGSADHTIKLLDVWAGSEWRTLRGHSSTINSVAFSVDSKTLVSGSSDATVKLWEVSTGTELGNLSGHLSDVTSVTLSPDGKTLASGGMNQRIKLWDLSTMTALRTLKSSSNSISAVASVIPVTFSADGKGSHYHSVKRKRQTQKPAQQGEILDALKAIARNSRSTASDILILYLSGHGVSFGGPQGDYYYLTSKAFSTHLEEGNIPAQTAISGKEIEDLILSIPARKRVLIMDTCAAGRLVEELEKTKAADGTNVRAGERMYDRTGLWVLAGSAADAVSYEASFYGQGLLTYSLLLGMKRDWPQAVEQDPRSNTPELVDVHKLFEDAAKTVQEELAPDIGGIQKAKVLNKRDARGFAIGRITSQDRDSIRLSLKKPVYLRSSFQLESRPRDPLDLSGRLDDQLRNISERGIDAKLVFWDVPSHQGTYRRSGQYTTDGAKVRVTVFISVFVQEGDKVVEKDFGAPFSLEADAEGPEDLVAKILEEVGKRICLWSSKAKN
jgi:WD domain, G-beta repeat/Caspase domain